MNEELICLEISGLTSYLVGFALAVRSPLQEYLLQVNLLRHIPSSVTCLIAKAHTLFSRVRVSRKDCVSDKLVADFAIYCLHLPTVPFMASTLTPYPMTSIFISSASSLVTVGFSSSSIPDEDTLSKRILIVCNKILKSRNIEYCLM